MSSSQIIRNTLEGRRVSIKRSSFVLCDISSVQDIQEWYPEQGRSLNHADGYYRPLRWDPQICLWPAARFQEGLWVASFEAVVTEVSISIFEVEITMEDAERLQVWISTAQDVEDGVCVMPFEGNRIRWGEDHGCQGMARNIADNGDEWYRPYEEWGEVEMERITRLEQGRKVILDISPKVWQGAAYRGCDLEIISLGVIVPAQRPHHFPEENGFEVRMGHFIWGPE
jgi:hypothetical protein